MTVCKSGWLSLIHTVISPTLERHKFTGNSHHRIFKQPNQNENATVWRRGKRMKSLGIQVKPILNPPFSANDRISLKLHILISGHLPLNPCDQLAIPICISSCLQLPHVSNQHNRLIGGSINADRFLYSNEQATTIPLDYITMLGYLMPFLIRIYN